MQKFRTLNIIYYSRNVNIVLEIVIGIFTSGDQILDIFILRDLLINKQSDKRMIDVQLVKCNEYNYKDFFFF